MLMRNGAALSKYQGGPTLPDAGPWGHRRWPCWYRPPFPVTWALPPCRQRRTPPKRHNPRKSSLYAICAWATLVPGSCPIPPNVSVVRPVSSGPNSSCSPGTLSVCTGGHPFFLFRLKIRSHVTLYTRHYSDYYYAERPCWFLFAVAFDRRQKVRLVKINNTPWYTLRLDSLSQNYGDCPYQGATLNHFLFNSGKH